MKALPIRQPWAALIVCGAKDVENRTWTTKHRGPLAIVASAGLHLDAHDAANATIGKLVAGSEYAKRYANAVFHMKTTGASMRGGLVGVVDLVDIVRDSKSPWAIDGHYHWILANARAVPFAAVKGRLQLFDVEVVE